MRHLTMILSCLLSLFGCHEPSARTSVTRVTERGADQLFSRTTVRGTGTTFECVRSASGRCHYQVFRETCAAGGLHCERNEVQRFQVRAGQQRARTDLPEDSSSCVAAAADGHCHHG